MDNQSVQDSDQAWAAWNVEAIKVMKQIHDHFRDEIDPLLWQDALRFALDTKQSAERCQRRACRAVGACQLRFKDGERLDCGAGLSNEILELAVHLALFGHLAWFERWWADMMGRPENE